MLSLSLGHWNSVIQVDRSVDVVVVQIFDVPGKLSILVIPGCADTN